MQKRKTGRVLTPQEFRNLNLCSTCGIASAIKYGERCADCVLLNLKQCKVCDRVLRLGKYKFYLYDIRDIYRENLILKPSVEPIREFFEMIEFMDLNDDDTCYECVNWKSEMKNNCVKCGVEFKNCLQDYRKKGNLCTKCRKEKPKKTLKVPESK